jgi:Htaa
VNVANSIESDAQKSRLIGLHWPLKASFLRYIANAPDGKRSVTDGAAWVDSRYFFFEETPGSRVDSKTGLGLTKFHGDVRFSAHGGALFMIFADPWVDVTGSEGVLSVRCTDQDENSRIPLLRLHLEPPRLTADKIVWNAPDATLTHGGALFFNGAYEEGTSFAPLSLSSARRVPADKERRDDD